MKYLIMISLIAQKGFVYLSLEYQPLRTVSTHLNSNQTLEH